MLKEKNISALYKKLNEFSVPHFCQIRAEMTNNCSYHCFMCPRSKLTRPKGIMSLENLNLLIDRLDFIKYDLDMHLHGYGEALLCNDLPERCNIITKRKPNFTPYIFTTIGVERNYNYFDTLFKNGLGKILISLYGYDEQTYHSVTGTNNFELVKSNLQIILSLRKKYGFQFRIQLDDFEDEYPCEIEVVKLKKIKQDFIKYLLDIGVQNNEIHGQKLHNFGNGFENFPEYKKTVPCSLLWGSRRSQLNVSWDMNVYPCSYDYNTEYIWGNLKNQSMEEIFKSDNRMNVLKNLLNDSNDNLPSMCKGCYSCEEGHFEDEYKIIKAFIEENCINE